jgi:hypothetical protein
MQFCPTNFLEMRMGSQLRSFERNVLNVVPAGPSSPTPSISH